MRLPAKLLASGMALRVPEGRSQIGVQAGKARPQVAVLVGVRCPVQHDLHVGAE